MYITCVECGASISRHGNRGRHPKRCANCKTSSRHARNRKRQPGKHIFACEQCGVHFQCTRKKQRYCSEACSRLGSRKRIQLRCANKTCGKAFEVTPSVYAKGSRCCSNKCKHEHMRIPGRSCHNPACGKRIERHSNGPQWAKYGKDKSKYCCTKCYHDHRWGENRPRKTWSQSHVQNASKQALQTSLRKKCKLLGVPYDPECVRHAVCQRDGWICQECRIECLKEWTFNKQDRQIDQRSAEHDHIIPLTTTGSPGNVFPNSQCLCHACNNRKRARAQGQMRLDLEGSVKRWEEGGLARNQRRSKSCAATPDAARSTRPSRSRQPMAL